MESTAVQNCYKRQLLIQGARISFTAPKLAILPYVRSSAKVKSTAFEPGDHKHLTTISLA